MARENVTTSTLLQRLFKTHHIGRFVDYYNSHMDTVSVSNYLNLLCEEKNLLPARVIQKSGIERTFGHQLFNGRRIPSRDKVIQLAFGFDMSYEDTQEFLKIARKSALYPKIKRDAVIIYALKHNLGIIELQATLDELALPLLGKEEHRYE